jgi:tRNA pseudouridine38-40 synthase
VQGGYQLVTINISANAFVYRMVRNIVSTLVEVGAGNIAPDSIPTLLAARDRQLVPAAAPAHGLFLVDVAYNKEDFIITHSEQYSS